MFAFLPLWLLFRPPCSAWPKSACPFARHFGKSSSSFLFRSLFLSCLRHCRRHALLAYFTIFFCSICEFLNSPTSSFSSFSVLLPYLYGNIIFRSHFLFRKISPSFFSSSIPSSSSSNMTGYAVLQTVPLCVCFAAFLQEMFPILFPLCRPNLKPFKVVVQWSNVTSASIGILRPVLCCSEAKIRDHFFLL